MDDLEVNLNALESSLKFHSPGLASQIFITSNENVDTAKNDEIIPAQILSATSLPVGEEESKRRSSETKSSNGFRLSAEELNSAEERQFMTKLEGFIVKHQTVLYRKDSANVTSSAQPFKEENLVFPSCPPLESFLSVSTKKLKDRFFKDIRVDDVVFGEIRLVENGGVTVLLLCVESHTMQRDLEQLHLEVFIPRSELVTPKPTDDVFAIYCKRKIVRACVSSINTEKRHLTLSIRSAECADKSLGIVSDTALPAYFRACQKEDHELSYETALKESTSLRNPNNVDALCEHFGISSRCEMSWRDALLNRIYQKPDFALELRKVQSYRLSMKSVAKGVEYLRNKQNNEAMQHFSRALDIDPDNVEGLVGRGALYANCESYSVAIENFERALDIEPTHANARAYLIETLLVQMKLYEKKRLRESAIECCQRILSLDSEHEVAKRHLLKNSERLKKRTGKRESEDEIIEIRSDDDYSGIKQKKSSKKRKKSRKHSKGDSGERRNSRKHRRDRSSSVSSRSSSTPSSSDNNAADERGKSEHVYTKKRVDDDCEKRPASSSKHSESNRKRRSYCVGEEKSEERRDYNVVEQPPRKLSDNENANSKSRSYTVQHSAATADKYGPSVQKMYQTTERHPGSGSETSIVSVANTQPDDPKLLEKLSDMEKFINQLKAKQRGQQ